MEIRPSELQRFVYSHYLHGGVRQGIGVLLPALFLVGALQLYSVGMIAAIGAGCVAILDQPGGPRRYGINGMLAAIMLGSGTALVTGFASSHSLLIWLLVPALCFVFSMLTVFGKQGGLLGFACLLIMTLTMRVPLSSSEVLEHTLYSFGGGVFYFVYSFFAHRLFWHREEQYALSAALFSTADYMAARSAFYDAHTDLESNYRDLIHAQSSMTEKHQAARDTVLRELPRGHGRNDGLRIKSLNVFIDMVALLDTLVATHTDYATLRRGVPDGDILIFARDALRKLSINVAHIALCVARGKSAVERNSVKAELRAIEYELLNYRTDGMAEREPEIYALLVQILRRLRNATRLVERMGRHTGPEASNQLVDMQLDKSLDRFLSRQTWRPGLFTSNLRLDSAHCRYAIRVTIAAMAALTVSALLAQSGLLDRVAPGLGAHSYWIVLTIVVVMKPGFALTRQRNGWRLTGTLVGCVLALVLFKVTQSTDVYLAVLIITCILGYSLVLVNFMLAALFNTVFVLLVFHFLSPEAGSFIGERLIDTLLGCGIALVCSYILPWWEHSYMASLARALRNANLEFLRTGLQLATLSRGRTAAPSVSTTTGTQSMHAGTMLDDTAINEAEVRWRLARKNVHIAFSNFTAAFYRMMDEPVRRQKNVPELNNLLIQNHVLALQITSAIPILCRLEHVPTGIQDALDAIDAYLSDRPADSAVSIETAGELAMLAYPLKQMLKASRFVHQELRSVG